MDLKAKCYANSLYILSHDIHLTKVINLNQINLNNHVDKEKHDLVTILDIVSLS